MIVMGRANNIFKENIRNSFILKLMTMTEAFLFCTLTSDGLTATLKFIESTFLSIHFYSGFQGVDQ